MSLRLLRWGIAAYREWKASVDLSLAERLYSVIVWCNCLVAVVLYGLGFEFADIYALSSLLILSVGGGIVSGSWQFIDFDQQ